MLKFEKEPKTSTVKLRFREREIFFEPQLLKAMGIAFLIHAAGLFIFHITPFKFSSTFVFSPVEVQFEHSFQGSTSAFAVEDKDSDNLPPPPLHLLPEFSLFTSTSPSFLIPEISFNTDILDSLEELIWPSWDSSTQATLLSQEVPLIRLWGSGDMAQREVINSASLLEETVLFSSGIEPVFVSYRVLLDELKGEIFWYEKTQSSGIDAIDQLTEKLLLKLRYAAKRADDMSEGILTFAVMRDTRKNMM